MDLESILFSEVSQTEKTNTVWYRLYNGVEKIIPRSVYATQISHKSRKWKRGYQWEVGQEGGGEEQIKGMGLGDTNAHV